MSSIQSIPDITFDLVERLFPLTAPPDDTALNFLTSKIHDRNAFSEKLKDSMNVIKDAIYQSKKQNKDICVSFNGGKDCCVVLYLFYHIAEKMNFVQNDNKLKVVNLKIKRQFEEMKNFLDSLLQNYYSASKIDFIENQGVDMRECLGSFKNDYPNVWFNLMGTRRNDGRYFLNFNNFQITDDGWPQFMRVCPILDWTYHEIWYFIKRFNIPYCKLYDEGYTSIDNADNTTENQMLYDEELRKYNPAYMLNDGNDERTGR